MNNNNNNDCNNNDIADNNNDNNNNNNNNENKSSEVYKIHGKNSKEFSHLAKYNMNDLCCRVVVYGEK